MKVEIKIDSSYIKPKIFIFTDLAAEDINNIEKNVSQIIFSSKDEKIELLE